MITRMLKKFIDRIEIETTSNETKGIDLFLFFSFRVYDAGSGSSIWLAHEFVRLLLFSIASNEFVII